MFQEYLDLVKIEDGIVYELEVRGAALPIKSQGVCSDNLSKVMFPPLSIKRVEDIKEVLSAVLITTKYTLGYNIDVQDLGLVKALDLVWVLKPPVLIKPRKDVSYRFTKREELEGDIEIHLTVLIGEDGLKCVGNKVEINQINGKSASAIIDKVIEVTKIESQENFKIKKIKLVGKPDPGFPGPLQGKNCQFYINDGQLMEGIQEVEIKVSAGKKVVQCKLTLVPEELEIDLEEEEVVTYSQRQN